VVRVRFRVLGTVEAVGPTGEPIALGDRQRALLASLLARAGQVVPADHLVELLWGDSDLPTDPAAALQSQVSRLRRALGSVAVHTRPPGYLLTVGPDDVDSQRFEHLVSAARSSSPEESERLLEEALRLWRGSAYAEFAETSVARFAAIRLEGARLDATEAWHRALLESGRAGEALPLLEAHVSEHPLRERARETLMRGLYELGRQADALAVYTAYEARLADELGLEPSAGLADLRLRILRHDLDGTPPDPPSAPLSGLRVRYIDTPGDRSVAMADVGSGPPVLALPGWVSSIEVIGSGRDLRSSLLQRLVDRHRVVVYDRFGTGLSAGEVDDFGHAASVAELAAVARAAGPPVHVLAMSQAGPLAVELAARSPELVSRLVLFGTYASGPQTFTRADLNAALVAMVRSHWGLASRLMADLYRPQASAEVVRHLADVLHDSAGPEVAAGYLASLYDVDVTGLLPEVRAPALVLHYRGDRLVPFAGARQLTAGLPDAQLVALDGPYHLPDARDLDRVVAAVREFLHD
jgi:DNA-binding SARP family transcriptional activator/pimeloyl-ACP methyl ester carboxylesterase